MHAENAVRRERASSSCASTARTHRLVARITGGVESEIGVEKRMRVLASALVPGFADMAVISAGTAWHRAYRRERAPPSRRTTPSASSISPVSAAPCCSSPTDIAKDRGGGPRRLLPGRAHGTDGRAHRGGPPGPAGGVQPFVADELMVARVVVDRVSVAIQQARLYEEQRAIAFTLQRNLLGPTSVAINEQLRVEAEYRPPSARCRSAATGSA